MRPKDEESDRESEVVVKIMGSDLKIVVGHVHGMSDDELMAKGEKLLQFVLEELVQLFEPFEKQKRIWH